jgi:hypothetical protein
MKIKKPARERKIYAVNTRVTLREKKAIEKLSKKENMSEGQWLLEPRKPEIEKVTKVV